MSPAGQKLREKIYSLETGHFWPMVYPRGRLIWDPLPKIAYGFGLVLKITSRSFHSFNSYSTFSQGQTDTHRDRQTHTETDRHADRHTPSHPYIDEEFFALFWNFHFTTSALLTLFTKDKEHFKNFLKRATIGLTSLPSLGIPWSCRSRGRLRKPWSGRSGRTGRQRRFQRRSCRRTVIIEKLRL